MKFGPSDEAWAPAERYSAKAGFVAHDREGTVKNLFHKLSSWVGSAFVTSLLLAGTANAAWEPAKNIGNQPSEAKPVGSVGWYVGLADGGNGVSTAFFDQTVGSNGYYAVRRGATDGAWGAPAPTAMSLPNGAAPFPNQPLSAAADANGNAIAGTFQTSPSGVFTASWPASAASPGSYSLLMPGSVTDPEVAFDSSGHGYAVAGEGQGASTNAPILISTYSPSTDSWSRPAAISVQFPQSSNCPNPPPSGVSGQEPRLAVSPDGTVVVAYLRAVPGTVSNSTSYQVCAVRAPAGAVAGSGGAGSFITEHQISTNPVQVTSNPGASPSTTPPNFDVAIDGADVATIVDAESQSGFNNAIFARRWLPGLDPSGQVQISTTSQPAPPASEPRVAASSSGDVTVAWTESGSNPASDTLVSAELPGDSAQAWLGPVQVSSAVDSPGGPAGYSVNTPPFWLAEDGAGTAYAVWTNNNQVTSTSELQDSIRQAGKAWSSVDTISGVPGTIPGTERVATGETGQADAVVVSNGSPSALYATRFSSPLPPPSTAPASQPQPGPSATPTNNPKPPPPEVPCNARPVLRIWVGRTHATKRSILVFGKASEHVCQHASAAQHAENHLVKVFVTIYHPAPLGKCRFLKRNGKLTPTVPCSKPITFVARGTKNWSLRLNLKVPFVRGGFLVRAWAVDGFGRQSVRGPRSVTHLKLPHKPKKHKRHG